jgi:hypothetical protein
MHDEAAFGLDTLDTFHADTEGSFYLISQITFISTWTAIYLFSFISERGTLRRRSHKKGFLSMLSFLPNKITFVDLQSDSPLLSEFLWPIKIRNNKIRNMKV